MWKKDGERIEERNIEKLRIREERNKGIRMKDYEEMNRWYVEDREGLWKIVWDLWEVIGESGNKEIKERGNMRGKIIKRGEDKIWRKNVEKKGRWGGNCI